MAVGDLGEQLHGLNLDDADHLPFLPLGEIERRGEQFDEVPRYLFRVFTAYSQGSTDMNWAKSLDAKNETADSNVDLFSRDKIQAAEMVNGHLQWSTTGRKDNLFFIIRIGLRLFLRAKVYDIQNFDQIRVCVIDTSELPKGVFLRDLDLIRAYREFNTRLYTFEELRCDRKRPGFESNYYFGEYLSQGALKIEGHCQIVSAQKIIDRGLYNIRSEFKQFAIWPPKEARWAYTVIEMRESFYLERQPITDPKLQSALDIANLFGPRWKLPIAIHLTALTAPQIDDDAILAKFRTLPDLLKEAEGHLQRATELTEEICSTEDGSISVDGFAASQKHLQKISSMSDKLLNDLTNMWKSFDDE
ncbi:hypothetical protein CFAM422_003438 [Trichoderma lentiforme]|uniref:DUF7587 domain-containing protein n=1 Tax=Trichoderma lentiforme TaxID=1567552 RepID=A0A9P5CE85_9HYPO|nr:hypothetical protein CFAM422_003438 [Trichoderma lentiforme]